MDNSEVFEMVISLKKSADLMLQQWVRLSRVRVAVANGRWKDGE